MLKCPNLLAHDVVVVVVLLDTSVDVLLLCWGQLLVRTVLHAFDPI